MKKKKIIMLMSGLLLCMTGITACTKQNSQTTAQTIEATIPNENNVVIHNLQVSSDVTNAQNKYTDLNVATYITKIGNDYFINDCYHDQIIYHDNIEDDLSQWKIFTDQVHYAHTIASDGTVFIVDDTENNRVLAFMKSGNEYVQTQILDNIGMKPHFVQYDEKRKTFFAWSSITGELFYLKRNMQTNEVYVDQIKKIDELYGVYVRSFTIMGDDIYFVSGHNNEKIIKANVDSLEIEETYPVSDQIAGMVQLVKIQDYYYITVSTDNQENQDYATIIRTKDLHSLAENDYEDIYDQFHIAKGTPYYITQLEDTYFLTHHRTDANVISFHVNNNEITDIRVIY